MIERLGQSEYGVYSIVLPMVSYLNLFSFGLGSAYTRFYTRYKEANDKYLSLIHICVYYFFVAGLTAASDDFVVGYINQSYHIEYLSQLAYRLPYFCVVVF